MGLLNDEESRHSSDAAESLPLYEEHHDVSAVDLKTPDDKATPDEVRDYLVAVMRSRGSGIDHARRVASKWNAGTGRELRTYPVSMYRDIFGAEDGWVVCREVHVRRYTQERKERPLQGWISTIVFSVLLICTLISATVGWYAKDVVQIGGWFAAYLFGMTTIGSFVFALIELFQTPEKKAEALLNSGWGKSTPPS